MKPTETDYAAADRIMARIERDGAIHRDGVAEDVALARAIAHSATLRRLGFNNTYRDEFIAGHEKNYLIFRSLIVDEKNLP